tara:strand:- start:262 stop:516 length:255 start_codon:yes stop_codon:yes gene_type:complete
MASNFDLTTLELLLQRLEKEGTDEMKTVVNELIMAGKKAGSLKFTVQEIASLCTMGFIVSQDPQLQSFVSYLISRLNDNDGVYN